MIWAGFLFGILGSFHCVGMCGPIAMALPIGRGAGWQFIAGRLLYNGGRILTYALLGGLAGLFGKSLQVAGFQQTISIVSGLLILALVVLPHFGGIKFTTLIGFDKVLKKVQGLMARQFQKNSTTSMGIIGMLNGILPCGFVYIALAGAVSVPSVGGSMLYMALFGLGTFPLMFLLSLSGKLVKPNFRHFFKKAVPYAATCMAVLFILRGLNLGIPYLSPQVVKAAGKTEMACCHKPTK
ncbi:sulfite exporter TauE/SafE family protein [Adhaeribacter soli]|uniref:Sulfite exporter TauE/SafE family protein n=1 Tax=Adhaeribacter soli TaxID=2607655 RepID=A0A5N1J8V9_9BACT|nr:sulfite exporter TauE/SafE family protein [Adhaeribacter soli]KAA9345735.1 sulfite exporter TauE/SafE family protein [Adhaeribacter soli]